MTTDLVEVPVGRGLLGCVVDPLGKPLDGKGPIASTVKYPVERPAAASVRRRPNGEPVQTGIMAIDAMVPIARGQRELIIGDRSTGKTSICIDTIINQARLNRAAEASGDNDYRPLFSIYVAIGQKPATIAQVIGVLRQAGALPYTVVVASTSSDPASAQYLAPFAGAAMAEWFIDNGMDTLIVYDDLSRHAAACRQEDVFHLHRRLLERTATATSLPIVETQTGDAPGYVPTNLFSITDGQIFLETQLFHQGVRPAIPVGISVSRLGSAAQMKAMRQVAGQLRTDFVQVREIAASAKLGSPLDTAAQARIDRGKRLMELFKQRPHEPMPVEEQVAAIWAVQNGYMDDVPVDRVKAFQGEWTGHLATGRAEILQQIVRQKAIDPELAADLKLSADRFKATVWRS